MLANIVSWGKRCGATMHILKSILNMVVKKMWKWMAFTLIWHVVKTETAAEGEGCNTFNISALSRISRCSLNISFIIHL